MRREEPGGRSIRLAAIASESSMTSLQIASKQAISLQLPAACPVKLQVGWRSGR